METRFMIRNARLSYHALYEPSAYKDNPPNYNGRFLIQKTDPQIQLIDQVINQLVEDNRGNKPVQLVETCKLDGDIYTKYPGWAGCWAIRASSQLKQPPQLRKQDTTFTAIQDALFYNGCYVDTMIDIYWQKTHSKCCAQLLAVQFRGDGELLVGTEIDENLFQNYSDPNAASVQTPAPPIQGYAPPPDNVPASYEEIL